MSSHALSARCTRHGGSPAFAAGRCRRGARLRAPRVRVVQAVARQDSTPSKGRAASSSVAVAPPAEDVAVGQSDPSLYGSMANVSELVSQPSSSTPQLEEAVSVTEPQPAGAGLGELHPLKNVPWAVGMPERDIVVWTPPNYDTLVAQGVHFPVVYCQDGQNLMDAQRAWLGRSWRLGAIATMLIEEGAIRAPIFVMISNVVVGPSIPDPASFFFGPERNISPLNMRFLEYRNSPLGHAYIDWMTDMLRPYVNANFATLQGPEGTFAMGSSLGGLVSFLAVQRRPNVYAGAACLSPAFDMGTVAEVAFQGGWGAGGKYKEKRLYLDNGGDTDETRVSMFDDRGQAQGFWWLDTHFQPALDAMLQVLDWQGLDRERLQYLKVPGAPHNEIAWGDRVDKPLRFLLGVPSEAEQMT